MSAAEDYGEVLDAEEAAVYLKIARKTVQTMAREGRLPGRKDGR